MITALICCHKSGDVIEYALKQLVDSPAINRILVADGPTQVFLKKGPFVESPTVKDVVDKINSKKIIYEYSDNFSNRPSKNNSMLAKHVPRDTKWILNVDSDEVYHEKDLTRLAHFLTKDPEFDRYNIHTIDPYPDLDHQIFIEDFKPRLYRWIPGAVCPTGNDRLHQYIFHKDHKINSDDPKGMSFVPKKVCQFVHLNAIREPGGVSRITKLEDGRVKWKGGKRTIESDVHDLNRNDLPKSLFNSDMKRPT